MFSIYLIEPAEAVRTNERFVPLFPRGTSGEREKKLASGWPNLTRAKFGLPILLDMLGHARLHLLTADGRRWTQMENHEVQKICVHLRSSAVEISFLHFASFSLNHPGRLVVMPSTPAASSWLAFAGESTVQT
jgi:hypothetical protein